jgi:hypothetical protein
MVIPGSWHVPKEYRLNSAKAKSEKKTPATNYPVHSKPPSAFRNPLLLGITHALASQHNAAN